MDVFRRARPKECLDALKGLPIRIDEQSDIQSAFGIARAHELYFYDALYLELAKRESTEFSTSDGALGRAVVAEGGATINCLTAHHASYCAPSAPRLRNKEGVHPLIAKAQEDALMSQLSDLEEQLREYESLKAGKFPIDELRVVAELATFLIKARIAQGLSQKDLAERLGLQEQQIQRYEATDYASASLTRIKEVVSALGVDTSNPALTTGSR